MKIIDLTEIGEDKVEPEKPIELVACLQSTKDDDGNFYFYKSNYEYSFYGDVKRLRKGNKSLSENSSEFYDVISVNGNLFLGHWNDGVVK